EGAAGRRGRARGLALDRGRAGQAGHRPHLPAGRGRRGAGAAGERPSRGQGGADGRLAVVPSLRIGCSGWAYDHWAGGFYPPSLKAKDRLAFYAARFDTCEINASFYRLPRESTVTAWRDGAPDGFVFAWKVSRFISHNKKLLDCEDSVDLVFGRMRPLGDKQGPALIQLPPVLKANPERLAAFAAWLPKDVRCAFEF